MTETELIQPTGFHLRLSSDWLVSAVSANIGDFLPTAAKQALGQPITALLCDDIIHDVRNRMALIRSEETVEHLFRVALSEDAKLLDLSIFRDGDGYGIDAEPSDAHAFGDATAIIDGMLSRIAAVSDGGSIGDEAARQLRALTGFDRALVVGEGKLIGQSVRPGQDSLQPLGSDSAIDHLAVTDRAADPVPILTLDHDRAPRSTLRVASKEEAAVIDSLKARAALVVPLLRDGRPWGHIGCYHAAPRHVGVERRSVASLFARFIALQLELAEVRGG